jgi:hypothetical protein
MDGAGGIQATRLAADLSSTASSITVTNTAGFIYADVVKIGNEEIRYVRKTATILTVAPSGRGYNGTKATTHTKGSMVYNSGASVLNSILGFNVISTDSDVSGVNMGIATINFFMISFPKLVSWDFTQFRMSEWTQLIRWFFVCFSAGITIYVIYSILSSLGGVAQSTLAR